MHASAEQISRRYGRALFQAAPNPEAVVRDLTHLTALIKDLPRLGQVWSMRIVAAESKQKLIDRVAEALQLQSVTVRLLEKLNRNQRFFLFPLICQAFTRYYQEDQKIRPVAVTTAFGLSKQQQQEFQSQFGQNAELSFQVDPDLIGGMTIRSGHRILDRSLARQLASLKSQLLPSEHQAPS